MYGQDGVSNHVVLNRTISEQHCCWPHHDHTLGVSSLSCLVYVGPCTADNKHYATQGCWPDESRSSD